MCILNVRSTARNVVDESRVWDAGCFVWGACDAVWGVRMV